MKKVKGWEDNETLYIQIIEVNAIVIVKIMTMMFKLEKDIGFMLR